MKTYTVKVKEVYTYEGVKAKNEEEAQDRVMKAEGWDYCDNQLEVDIEEDENDN